MLLLVMKTIIIKEIDNKFVGLKNLKHKASSTSPQNL